MRHDTEFTITDEHLKLARSMYVSWCGDEFGAPSIDPKRPYGNGDVIGDLADLLGVEATGDDYDPYPPETVARLRHLHDDMEVVLQIVLATGSFTAGTYRRSKYGNDWALA